MWSGSVEAGGLEAVGLQDVCADPWGEGLRVHRILRVVHVTLTGSRVVIVYFVVSVLVTGTVVVCRVRLVAVVETGLVFVTLIVVLTVGCVLVMDRAVM